MSPFMWVSLFFFVSAIVVGFLFSAQVVYIFLGVGLVIYFTLMFFGVTRLSMHYFGPAFCRNPKAGKKVAFTFDDGPDARVTPQLLQLLRENNIKATFFVTGNAAQENKELLKQIVEEGHTIGNHTYHHYWWTNFMGERALAEELRETTLLLREITAREITYFRPPVGLTNNIVARVIKQQGLKCIGFSAGRYDQKAFSGSALAERIFAQLKGGEVIVLHDGGRQNDQVLISCIKILLNRLKEAGYEVVSLENLINNQE